MAQGCSCDNKTILHRVSSKCVTEEYWRRKLPPGFRYVLDTVARNVMRKSPQDIYLYSSILLEEMMLQRRKERSMLPDWPYFNKFLRRIEPARVPPRTSVPKAPPPAIPPKKKCCKCGRILEDEQRPVPGIGVYTETPEDWEGRKLVCGGSCRILALDLSKDPFGHRDTRREFPDKEPSIVSCRSLAMLVDY
ncbi:uncharacterized protein LOC112554061 [Pomacea canaliculata]|uniref:uncharacterized protein LOC112554061 n=1 Tax=Pomacea canaliculata TaxID=400727 RepID=UPI000D731378|nr:uncharacterized protein LOC112554061 [Pomacea canaliculata]